MFYNQLITCMNVPYYDAPVVTCGKNQARIPGVHFDDNNLHKQKNPTGASYEASKKAEFPLKATPIAAIT